MCCPTSRARYRILGLKPGEYEVLARAVGFKSEPRDVKLVAKRITSIDFALEKGTVRWSDFPYIKAKSCCPRERGKQLITAECFACHGFQSRMAAVRRDADGWAQVVNYMRDVRHARLGNHIDDQACRHDRFLFE